MPKLTTDLLKKMIAEEVSRLHEDHDLNPQKIKAAGKLNVELSNLLKAINTFKMNVLDDPNMGPLKNDPSMPSLLDKLKNLIGQISSEAGNYVSIADEAPKVKPKVKAKVLKPNVKVV